ncbi:MAG: hypothetical protein GOVbin4162_118 [Prokaryotic dsDNA virus sp.]|nr:MAG: hypothetical protein GOVbin4162_118 [Prokaryotic dsDNA virus sp.]|tara:strand:- start:386 stop:676 length:291 start_codon:yes stop_codon:yes gene_type:complete
MREHLIRLINHPDTIVEKLTSIDRDNTYERYSLENPCLPDGIVALIDNKGEHLYPKKVFEGLSPEDEIELCYLIKQRFYTQGEDQLKRLADSIKLF